MEVRFFLRSISLVTHRGRRYDSPPVRHFHMNKGVRMPALARVTDLPASHEAAVVASINQALIKSVVEGLLLDAGPNGLTDRELTLRYFADPKNPECELSTPRKRRSDLTRERLVLVTAMRRKGAGERVASHVWVHRQFYMKRKSPA